MLNHIKCTHEIYFNPQLFSNDANNDRDADDEKNAASFTFKPNQLEIVRQLFVEAMVTPGAHRTRSSTIDQIAIEMTNAATPTLTEIDDLFSFLLLVSQATTVGSFTSQQSLALGVVCRSLFWGNGVTGKSLKVSSQSHDSMHEIIKISAQKSLNISHENFRTSSLTKDNVEDGFGINSDGSLEYSDLMFALSDGSILYEMMNVRVGQLLNSNLKTARSNSSNSTLGHAELNEPSSRPTHTIQPRNFGCDYKIAQLVLYATRYALKRKRGFTAWLTELALFLGGGLMIGSIVGPTTSDKMVSGKFVQGFLNLVMIFGILATISALSTFGSQKLIFWRESSYGISITSVWLARNVVDIVFLAIQSLVWSSVLFGLITPSFTSYAFFSFWFAQAFANSGIGYVLSTVIPSQNLTLYSAMITACGGMFLCGVQENMEYLPNRMKIVDGSANIGHYLFDSIMSATYSKWMLEALCVTQVSHISKGKAMTFSVQILNGVGFGTIDQISNQTTANNAFPLLAETINTLVPDSRIRSPGFILNSTFELMYPLFIIGVMGRLLALLGLFVMDRPQQNKTTCSKLIYQALCKLRTLDCSCCTGASVTRSKSLRRGASHDSSMDTGMLQSFRKSRKWSVFAPTKNQNGLFQAENTTLNPLEQQVRDITRGSFATQEAFEALDAEENKSAKQTRAARKTQLLTSTKVAAGKNERAKETWEKRIGAHGLSSQTRIYNRKKKLANLFEFWDKLGDGFIGKKKKKKELKFGQCFFSTRSKCTHLNILFYSVQHLQNLQIRVI